MNDFENIYNAFLSEENPQANNVLQSKKECYNFYKYIKQTQDIDGHIVEVGVYEGGSASLINKFKEKNKTLYLFDTFCGLQDVGKFDNNDALHNGGISADSYDRLKKYFINDNVNIIKGYFPESCPISFQNKKFSFVHLDADTYLSTHKALEFFYNKMSIGGIILSHDYTNNHAPGVKKAVDEFLLNKKEITIILDDSQSLIIKS
jgi:hypothetical protein